MGLYNSTMAISKRFTVGLNVNNLFSVSDRIFRCQINSQDRQPEPNADDPGRLVERLQG